MSQTLTKSVPNIPTDMLPIRSGNNQNPKLDVVTMKIDCQRCEDSELKALYDEGMDVSWAAEIISFFDEARTLVFRLDDSMPGEAMFSTIIVEDQSRRVKLGATTYAANKLELPSTDPLLTQAVEFLKNRRQVQQIAIYDGPAGFNARVPVSDIAAT